MKPIVRDLTRGDLRAFIVDHPAVAIAAGLALGALAGMRRGAPEGAFVALVGGLAMEIVREIALKEIVAKLHPS